MYKGREGRGKARSAWEWGHWVQVLSDAPERGKGGEAGPAHSLLYTSDKGLD